MRALQTLGLLGLYVGSQLTALALAFPFIHAGLQTNSSPNSITNILPFVIAIVAIPIVIIGIAKYTPNLTVMIKYFILFAISLSLVVTLGPTLDLVLPGPFLTSTGTEIDLGFYFGLFITGAAFLLLLLDPQWFVVDGVGYLAAGALTAILGVSLGILPVLVLLMVLMVYDAVAVYGTKHMLSLADVVADMKLPILLVMPENPSFDYAAAPSLKETREKVRSAPEEREATFMGLGDVVIPGVLVVSAFVFLPSHLLGGFFPSNLLVALSAMFGSLLGYGVLMYLVSRGNAQAGLPFLNGLGMSAYALSYILVFHNYSLGIVLPHL
jgi:presenilin-like A22 family membrane protease